MSFETFYGKGPPPLLWAGSRSACGQITVSGTPNCQNYFKIFIVYTQFTNVTADRITQHGGPRDRYAWFKARLTNFKPQEGHTNR